MMCRRSGTAGPDPRTCSDEQDDRRCSYSGCDTQMATLPASQELRDAERVARRFYLDDRTKLQIAAEMGVSRFRIARLLDLAH